MPTQPNSPAVAVARAHVEAWSNHDFNTARDSLAADVTVTSTTTQPIMKAVNLAGIDDYMIGLTQFAQGVVPGSAHIIASVGDERNALLLLTMTMAGGPFGAGAQAPCARIYLVDDNGKIKTEQVVFYVAPE